MRRSSIRGAALGLIDRGALRPGFAADINDFEPASIADRATFNEPRRYPAGITQVIVNGVAVIAGGAPSPTRVFKPRRPPLPREQVFA